MLAKSEGVIFYAPWKSLKTFQVHLYISGQFSDIKRVYLEFISRKFCLTAFL